jgi:hypothetical protein
VPRAHGAAVLRLDPLPDEREADPVSLEYGSIEDLTLDERRDLLVQEYLTAPLFHHLIGGLGSVGNLQTQLHIVSVRRRLAEDSQSSPGAIAHQLIDRFGGVVGKSEHSTSYMCETGAITPFLPTQTASRRRSDMQSDAPGRRLSRR